MIQLNEYLINKTTRETVPDKPLQKGDKVLIVDLFNNQAFLKIDTINQIYAGDGTIVIGRNKFKPYNRQYRGEPIRPEYKGYAAAFACTPKTGIELLDRCFNCHGTEDFFYKHRLYVPKEYRSIEDYVTSLRLDLEEQ